MSRCARAAVAAGTVHDAAGVYTEYVDPRREAWFRAANVLSLNEWERETGNRDAC